MRKIHPSALVDPRAKLGDHVEVGPFAVVGPDVELGENVVVQGHAMETWEKGGDYRDRVLGDARISELLSKEEIDAAFSLEEALRHVDAIFERTLREGGER